LLLRRERPAGVSLDKIKREFITTTAREDGKCSFHRLRCTSLEARQKMITRLNTLFLCIVHLDDLVGPDDDLSNVAITDDAFDELQAVVNKTMKLKTKKDTNSAEKVRFMSRET
jgi:hypothetical protein